MASISESDKYNYTNIIDLQIDDDIYYNVYGVVRYIKQPSLTRSNQFCMSIGIVDQTLDLKKNELFHCCLFAKTITELPTKALVGNIIRFHRLWINSFNGVKQGKAGPGFSWLLIRGIHKESSHKMFTFERIDEQKISGLQAWIETNNQMQLMIKNSRKFLLLSDVKIEDQWIDVVVQVYSIHPGKGDDKCTIIRGWDGSIPSFHSFNPCGILQPYEEPSAELQYYAATRIRDFNVFDIHQKDAQDLKPGDFIRITNLHMKTVDLSEQHTVISNQFDGEMLEDPKYMSSMLHDGKTYNRGIQKLSETDPDVEEVKKQIQLVMQKKDMPGNTVLSKNTSISADTSISTSVTSKYCIGSNSPDNERNEANPPSHQTSSSFTVISNSKPSSISDDAISSMPDKTSGYASANTSTYDKRKPYISSHLNINNLSDNSSALLPGCSADPKTSSSTNDCHKREHDNDNDNYFIDHLLNVCSSSKRSCQREILNKLDELSKLIEQESANQHATVEKDVIGKDVPEKESLSSNAKDSSCLHLKQQSSSASSSSSLQSSELQRKPQYNDIIDIMSSSNTPAKYHCKVKIIDIHPKSVAEGIQISCRQCNDSILLDQTSKDFLFKCCEWRCQNCCNPFDEEYSFTFNVQDDTGDLFAKLSGNEAARFFLGIEAEYCRQNKEDFDKVQQIINSLDASMNNTTTQPQIDCIIESYFATSEHKELSYRILNAKI